MMHDQEELLGTYPPFHDQYSSLEQVETLTNSVLRVHVSFLWQYGTTHCESARGIAEAWFLNQVWLGHRFTVSQSGRRPA